MLKIMGKKIEKYNPKNNIFSSRNTKLATIALP